MTFGLMGQDHTQSDVISYAVCMMPPCSFDSGEGSVKEGEEK